MPVEDYFPGAGPLLRVARAWPRVFAHHPEGTLVIAMEGDQLAVLCTGDAPLALVQDNANEIIRLLNRLLDGDLVIKRLEAIPATRAELYLARDLLALKAWLIDYDIGF
ncbi:hypothetical protein NBH00_21855 [Paraconexibacter antarcticus]|uniref:Uncharacterized protein n=1 Tax=Paraconexibacter antarcticus TaxID=2949664 RepID=A0ABY5DRU0_9ACTN|nr:hypothetical protein [Paraconexibacter antarcticus]UTI63973.1 hypothetical protein NBH00_21855 [Paraconexibacter antarcticus]